MRTVTGSLAAAIGAAEQTVDGRLRVDWDRDGYDADTSSGSLASFGDTFPGSSLDATKWSNVGTGTVTVSGNRVGLASNVSTYGHIASVSTYRLTGSGVGVKLETAGYLKLVTGTGDQVGWVVAGTTIEAYIQDAGTVSSPSGAVAKYSTYDAIGQLWLRIHESAGVMYWDTSPDGATWTNYLTLGYQLSPAAVTVHLTGDSSGTTSSTGFFSRLGTPAWPTLDDLSATLDGLTIDRTLTSEYPDAARIVSGTAAAAMTAELAGGQDADERHAAAWYYSTANSASPIAGKERLARPVTADIAYQTSAGTEYVRVYTGLTRSISASASNLTAELDGTVQVQGQVTLPGITGADDGLNATWIVSYALAQAGVYAGPPRMDRGYDAAGAAQPVTRYWAPMHGSQHPFLADQTGQHFYRSYGRAPGGGPETGMRPPFVPGPYALGTSAYWRANDDYCRLQTDTQPAAGRSILGQDWSAGQADLWVRADANPLTATDFVQWNIVASTGAYVRIGVNSSRIPYIVVYDGGPGSSQSSTVVTTLPTDSAWHSIRAAWDIAGKAMIITVDGVPHAYSIGTVVTTYLPTTDTWPSPGPSLTAYLPVAEVQINSVVYGATRGLAQIPFTPGAVLDRSTLDLDAQIERNPREVWDLCKEIAAAEQATVQVDEDGVVRYRTRARLVDTAGATVQRTITADTALTAVQVEQTTDQVVNTITVPAKNIVIQRSVPVLQDRESRVLPPQRTTRFVIPFQSPVTFLYTSTIANDGPPNNYSWPTTSNFFNMCSVRQNADGSGSKYSVTATIITWDLNSVTIDVANPYGQTLYLANQDTTPVNPAEIPHCSILLFGDMAVIGTDVVSSRTNATSVAKYGAQTLNVSGSQWIQQPVVADSIALQLAVELGSPHNVASNVECVGDPRSQLADRVRIQDPDGTALDGQFWLSAIRHDLKPGEYMQQITAREAGGIFTADGPSVADGPDRVVP